MITFTRESLIERAQARLELMQAAAREFHESPSVQMDLKLARITLESLNAAPVAWTDEQELKDVEDSGCGYLFTVNPVTQYADPFRVIKLFTFPPAPVVPDTLPCAVELKPGFIIGKGCKTETLLTALQRRADYCAEIDAMTPEERAVHNANIEAFKTMLSQSHQPVSGQEQQKMGVER